MNISQLRMYLFASAVLLALTACGSQQIPGAQLFNSSNPGISVAPKKLKQFKAPAAQKVVWSKPSRKFSRTHYKILPSVHQQQIIVAGLKSISSYQITDGKQFWLRQVPEEISAGVSTDAAGKYAAVGTVNGNVIIFERDSGKITSSAFLKTEIASLSDIHNNHIVVKTVDGGIHNVNIGDSSIVWSQYQSVPNISLLGASKALITKVKSTDIIISGFDNGNVTAYEMVTGKLVWQTALSHVEGEGLDKMTDVDGTMKLLNSNLFVVSLNGKLAGMNVANGEIKWSRDFSSNTGVDADHHAVYSTDSDGNIWRINPHNGQPVWKVDDFINRFPTRPSIINSRLLSVADQQGNIHFIDTQKGRYLSRIQPNAAPYISAPLVIGRNIIAYDSVGLLSVISNPR